ncbi:COX15/CtaA family protein [Pararhodonellum marinum]|uniref:COX15/CtaA family protein n=1 Tax=Pararhodonellum marinum TaxID=2755358 RepID=UPI00188E95B0|nr:COX15/CtaA family protein [Pararhodonellum marinum]
MRSKKNKQVIGFRRISLITVIAVYFLILIGGVVRSAGAGMGCPDWPKCFGSWIPPTSVDQLPPDYQNLYVNKRVEKNEKFAATLSSIGFTKKAEQLKNDKSILIEEEFNASKTWIEYINRLIGAVIGLLIIGTFLYSLKLWKSDKYLTILSFASVVLVIFQGWIGSIVVSTNLLPWMITFHMLLALMLVCLLLYIHYRAYYLIYPLKIKTRNPSNLFYLLTISMVLMLVQIVMGTQVREAVDTVAFQFGNMFRSTWVENLGIPFLIHRSYSLILLGIHVWFLYKVYQYSLRNSSILKWSQVLLLIIFLEIFTGVGMAYFGIPPFLQPIHLLLGTLIIGNQFVILMILRDQMKLEKVIA